MVAKEGWTPQLAADVDSLLCRLAAKSADSYLEAATWRLRQLLDAWAAAVRASGGDAGSPSFVAAAFPLAVELWSAVVDLTQERKLLAPGGGVSDEARQAAGARCVEALHALGLRDSAAHVASLLGPSRHRRRRDGADGLGLSDARFQLRFCGPLLLRESPSDRDPRVDSFNPDPWQRQVWRARLESAAAGTQ